ncbi:phospholipid phosphatase homolog 1.2 homolog isoform X7 [Phymastichus coffea]|nr:phospholipid phosphatase homolog 1.2 homolog isoform X7 [Phymastichus coffea]XP_058804748.1 phospholipid phosphatase homolog 1.2 homolog isoform X7 [Phymastichus coffea]XP_058804749.1 phospholipid phosphatase homolog 1.2 homolog isoform X7 [Phymastichus coffea]XP_058804750.1 phospholipid phosphatase homolog 1.2 homolog isoform X7 [Phymastichus coffea]
MTVCRTRVPWRFSANFFIALTVSLIMLLGELGWIPNQKVGFYCNDPKISFKFTGDSISMATLLVVSIVVPALVVWAVEWCCYSPDSYKSLECGSSSRSRQFWAWYGYYSLGWWYLIFVVEVIKVVVGEPRPHFFDSCRPKEVSNCSADEFKTSYTCTNTELSWFYVNDSDKSFPSGHSALSIFTATFLIWYLQCRMPERLVLILVKPWLQCLAVLWGLGCSLSRITDKRHHWWDVAAGSLLGLLFGLFTVRVLCRRFEAAPRLPAHLALEANAVAGLGALPSPPPPPPANGYAAPDARRHQSVKKLLSASSSIDLPDSREMGDLAHTWTA